MNDEKMQLDISKHFDLALELEAILLMQAKQRGLEACFVGLHLFHGLILGLLKSGWTENELIGEVRDVAKIHFDEGRKQ